MNKKIKVKYYTPIINWCDFQSRIFKNTPHIRWKNKVHETLSGQRFFAALPAEEQFSLYHHKHISKQEKQNSYYDTL